MNNVDAHAADSHAAPALERMLTGALPLYRTVGGHHRYRLADVMAFLGLDAEPAAVSA